MAAGKRRIKKKDAPPRARAKAAIPQRRSKPPVEANKKKQSNPSEDKTSSRRQAESRLQVGGGRGECREAEQRLPAGTGKAKRTPIVGIGASAGGLRAFEELLQHMPADSGMAFIVVSHLDPDHGSILHELLRKYTRMPVEQIRDATAVEANRVYVVPPGKSLAVMNGVLHLMQPVEPHGARLPIDYFFRSLAEDQKESAVGVILSGNGSDGTLGIKAIKGEAGLTLAQDPASAKFPGMPSSAIASGMVDFILPAEAIPAQLLSYLRHPGLGKAAADPEEEPPTSVMQKIFLLLRSRAGHDFSLYKPSTIRRRIARRMNIHQIDSHRDYIRYLERNPQEVDLLFKELLIGVTGFFRDAEAFDALARLALPDLLRNRSGDLPLRAWVPGCSTGEEAFSLAILLREAVDHLKLHRELQIFATDLDADAIDAARVARYPGGIEQDVNPKRLQRFFTKEDDHYRIRKELREKVVFAVQDIIKDPPFTRLDLICCRNLLIYFQPELQKRLMPLFHYAIRPGGMLFMGTSESIGSFSSLFQPVDKKWKLFRRKEGAARMIESSSHLHVVHPQTGDECQEDEARGVARASHSLTELASKALADRYAPPSVIVNERGDIVYFHGQTGLYLQPPSGQPSHNIYAMAREGLRLELATAMRKASGREEEVVHKGVEVKVNGSYACIDLCVKRITVPESLRGLIMVTFKVASDPKTAPGSTRTASTARRGKGREADLDRELRFTKANLQSTIEELETSNEELKSTNEELQSTNEELQSTNEELETSKEEMQSLNEELQTVNAELQGKVEELSRTYDDMTNLLNATDIATIFLDNDLNIKRFTTQATSLFRLIQGDVGRPVTDIVSRLRYSDLEEDARQVLRTLSFQEKEVQCETGQWYTVRVLPYRTAENVIDGLVLTFVNIDRIKQAELRSRDAETQLLKDAETIQSAQYALSILDTTPDSLVVLDDEMRIRLAGAAFYRAFKTHPEDTINRRLYDLDNGVWDSVELRDQLEDVLLRGNGFDGLEVDREFSVIGHRRILLSARRMERREGLPSLILLAMEDATPGLKEARRDDEIET